MTNKMNISILTFSCCNPSLKTMDEQYVSRVKEVLDKINAEAKIEVVTATEARYGREVGDFSKLRSLFNKYGMDAMPALFINGELVLYGGLPSIEKLSEVIGKAANPTKKEAI
jgi:Cys-tRNA synthase (O-phospho-L-seryl-tRNA:Cys-tRNA synthase)